MFSKIAAVAGMPRSGTSWLGEIVATSPAVAYFFQPFFSYKFKGRITCDSTTEEMRKFFQDVFISRDDFLLQTEHRSKGVLPELEKSDSPTCLAFKTCRYQYLLPNLIQRLENFFLLGIVRNPCGAINSWLRNPKEFPSDADPHAEWRFGACKNQGREEEFFGYYKWKEVANLYLDLQQKHPNRVLVITYEELVKETLVETEKIFKFLGLGLADQTREFALGCHLRHSEHPNSVFKDKSVATHWRQQLDPLIRDEILFDLKGTRLERFTNL